ncbi:MAG: hypothetical protein HY094_05970 [Candidatus Melainabacteria bacterium]|nr:hypothetical protein [Candidatus Melainabacteria bacterium]
MNIPKLILASALSLPLVGNSFGGDAKKSDPGKKIGPDIGVVKSKDAKTKEVIDQKRKVIQENEIKLINKLDNLTLEAHMASYHVQLGIDNLEERKKIADIEKELTITRQNFILEVQKKNNLPKQLEAFRNCMSVADKAAMLILPHVKDVSLNDFGNKVEKNYREALKKANKPVDEDGVKGAVLSIKLFKETVRALPVEGKQFISDLEIFNKNAQAANQPVFKSKLLDLDFLKSLKSIK